jgi:hypothetical protein
LGLRAWRACGHFRFLGGRRPWRINRWDRRSARTAVEPARKTTERPVQRARGRDWWPCIPRRPCRDRDQDDKGLLPRLNLPLVAKTLQGAECRNSYRSRLFKRHVIRLQGQFRLEAQIYSANAPRHTPNTSSPGLNWVTFLQPPQQNFIVLGTKLSDVLGQRPVTRSWCRRRLSLSFPRCTGLLLPSLSVYADQ